MSDGTPALRRAAGRGQVVAWRLQVTPQSAGVTLQAWFWAECL
jgi:hypothetical protein